MSQPGKHLFVFVSLCTIACSAAAQEFTVKKSDAPPPADALAPEIAAQLAPQAFQVAEGSRVVCEIWLCKEWPIAADAKTTPEIQYPFTPGQVLGAVRYPRKSSDFRDQEVAAGVYVLRYAQQPVDGAHVGTFPTRDFAALLPAAKDRAVKELDYKTLTTLSKETTGTAHPAIRPLLKPQATEAPAISKDEEHEWTMVRLAGKTKAAGAAKDLALEMVVAGVAAE
jgi:hypothetical protein